MSGSITASEQRRQEYLSPSDGGARPCRCKARLLGYCTGLLLPGERKSAEPVAAPRDPAQVPSLHQALHHFAATAAWREEAVLTAVRAQVLPRPHPAWPGERSRFPLKAAFCSHAPASPAGWRPRGRSAASGASRAVLTCLGAPPSHGRLGSSSAPLPSLSAAVRRRRSIESNLPARVTR